MTTNPALADSESVDGLDNSFAGRGQIDLSQEDPRKSSSEDDDNTTCGWRGCRPNCIQKCNRSVCFLVFWSLFGLFQSTTVNGLVYVVTTTLERRFSLTSARSGAISSTFDFTTLSLILFFTYLTERLHKPLLLGGGAIVFGLGSFVFTLPHFLSPEYGAGEMTDEAICRMNETAGKCDEDTGGSLSGFYWYFIAGQVLHGIGACPLYTHGRTFVYENVQAQLVPIYFAISQLMASLGVAVGYLFGGVLLQMYTEVTVDTQTIDITPNSPQWIGNWWIGFLIVGSLTMVTSIPLMGFPKSLRGTKAIREENANHLAPQDGSEFHSTRGLKGLLRDFPRAVWNLVRNVPLMCVNLSISAEIFIIACLSVFGPKYLEVQFNIPAGTAAILAGVVVVPASVIGVLTGGWIIKRFDLKFVGQAKLSISALLLSFVMMFTFLIGCQSLMFAGVTTSYDDGFINNNSPIMPNITDVCNVRCNCLDSFAPVCGSNNVMYYSACHAGCSSIATINDTEYYVDCTCVPSIDDTAEGTAVEGRCDVDCDLLYIFLALLMVVVLTASIALVPSQTMSLGVVSPSQRTTAAGLQSLMFRAFGSVPGPIIFGTIIDNVCLIWEYDCYGAKTCWMYQTRQLSVAVFTMLVISRLVSLLFFTGALFSYKPSKHDAKDEVVTGEVTKAE